MAKQSNQAATPAADAPKKPWKPSYRFCDYKRRQMFIKLVDSENGFPPGEVRMTVNGPIATSHAAVTTIPSGGYVATTESEEKALLALANKPNHGRAGGSWLVTWENRLMPAEQRKAEVTSAELQRKLDSETATSAELREENERLRKQLEGLKPGG